jgi:hypothetical protein
LAPKQLLALELSWREFLPLERDAKENGADLRPAPQFASGFA